jgi:hypothetical protein
MMVSACPPSNENRQPGDGYQNEEEESRFIRGKA